MLQDISNNLVNVCDAIIEQQSSLKNSNDNAYSKNGKKYRLTSAGQFIRVQDENKHLIVAENYDDYKKNYSILSSYHILKSCGSILQDYKKLSLAIIFTSREIELNKWYDESSKITSIDNSFYDIYEDNNELEALNYISNVDSQLRDDLIILGSLILTATKINFFQTDHNVSSPNLEGFALRNLIKDNCTDSALSSFDVYNALRAFSHWCSIKGIFYRLSLPNLNIDNLLIARFNSFIDIPKWISDSVKGRYPAGCSKLALIKKSLFVISNSIYGNLIEPPHSPLDLKYLLTLCQDIENDPLKYHIRSNTLHLSNHESVQLSNVFKNSDKWILYISCILQAIGNYRLPYENKLLISNKILKVNRIKDNDLFKKTHQLVNKMQTLDRIHSKQQLSDAQLLALLGGPLAVSLSSQCGRFM